MSDRAALIAAICANPEEDTPRLMYADWLDEHGQAKRAAFIRAKVEQHRLESADTAACAVAEFLNYQYDAGVNRINWSAVDAEVGAILAVKKAGGKLKSPLTPKGEGVPHVEGVKFQGWVRGFYHSLWVEDTDAFLANADAIFRAAPITDVAFESLTEEQAEEFARAGHLARVRHLDLEDDVEADAVRALGSHRDAEVVKSLDCGGYGMSATDLIGALAAGKHWGGLESLYLVDLSDCDDPPEPEQMAGLFRRKQFHNLRKLTVWGCGLEYDAARAIAKNMPELRYLDLALNVIGAAGAAALAASKSLRHLCHLDLASCEIIDGEAVAKVINSPNLPGLAVLRLDGNDFDGPHAKALAQPGRGPGLRALDLGSSRLTPAGAEALARCPAARGVWHLKLDATGMADEALERFIAGAAFERLTYLDLSQNQIGESGAKALAASPHLKGLKFLHTTGRGVSALKKRFKKVFG